MNEPVEDVSFEAAMAAAMATMNQPAPEAAPEPEKPATTEPEVPPAPPAPSAAELERIAALEAREAKLREAEAKAKADEAARAEAAAKSTKQWDAFIADPVGHIRAMRPELSSSEAAAVAEKLYFHALGDKAPPEHRIKQEVAQVKTEVSSEVAELRAKLEESEARLARQAAEAELKQYRTELRTGAAAVSDAPIVSGLLQRNPARAEELLFEVARQDALEKQRAGQEDPPVLTPAEAAAKLEALLKAQRDELYGAPAAVEAPQNGKQSPSPTITNRDASIQPTRVVPDPLDDRELRKQALKAAGLDIPVWD